MALHKIISPLYLLSGLQLLFRPGIRRYVIMPLLINFALFALFIIFGITQFSQLIDGYMPSMPEWLQWVEWLLWPLFIISFIAAGFFFSLMLANFIAAPFNGFLAEAILRQLRPDLVPAGGNWKDAIKTIGPTLRSEAGKLGYFAVRALPLLVLFLIPGLNLLAPLLWLIFSAWVLALEYLDYPMSTQGLLFKGIRQQLGQRRLSTLGFGGGILLLTVIPVLNFFIMPIAVAGATALYVEKISKKGR